MNKFEKLITNSWQDIAFCCALIERMTPNYALFSEISEYGDENILKSGIDVLWTCCAGHEQQVNFEKQLEKLELVTPDMNDFDNFGVRPAVDACVALSMLFEVCAGMQELDVASASSLYISTIQAYLEVIEGAEIDDSFTHPLLDDAEGFFAAVNELLKDETMGRVERVKTLKVFSRGLGVSNIGIE